MIGKLMLFTLKMIIAAVIGVVFLVYVKNTDQSCNKSDKNIITNEAKDVIDKKTVVRTQKDNKPLDDVFKNVDECLKLKDQDKMKKCGIDYIKSRMD